MIEASSPDTLVLSDGVWLLFRPLPYPAVCGILPDLGDGVLRIVADPSKLNALAHVLRIVRREYGEDVDLGPADHPN
jgi:hypothetical protein